MSVLHVVDERSIKIALHSGLASRSRRPSREPSLLRSNGRSGSVRSKHSVRSESADASESEDLKRTPIKRRLSKSESIPSRPPSRPVSRLSRKRSDSNAAAGSDKETEKDKLDGKSDKQTRRLSVTGWASSAVGSVTSLGKKNKDKDKFSALQENDEQEAGQTDGRKGLKRSNSNHSMGIISHIRNKSRDTPTSSPKIPPRILKPPSLQEKKVVRALYDFTGAPDELAFKAGDEIVVLNEVLDDWWMGEMGGRTGLFPTAYVEVVPVVPKRPTLPPRISRQDSTSKQAIRPVFSEEQLNRGEESVDDGHSTDDGEDYHDFSAPPLTPRHSPFYGVPSDTLSITSSNADEESYLQQQQVQNSRNLAAAVMGDVKRPIVAAPPIARSSTADSSTAKKAPPPPPPRRATTTNITGALPIPERPMRPRITRTHSTSSGSTPPSSIEGRERDYDTSPFESASELTSLNTSNTDGTTNTNGCKEFKQNPFKPKGMCSNCFNYH